MLRPLLATALLAVAAPVFAADQAAKANFGPQQITWEPQIAHESTVLTVSTPSGKVERHEFKGTPPTFELSTSAADGTYHWELQILPAAQPRHRRAQQGGEEAMAGRAQGAIVSGTFSVVGGQIVSPDAREPRVAAQKATPVVGLDQVIPDDLIVQGSACVGLDCVNNESFGFDTIRLKENNTRIKFDDTSVGSFPANDWQLTANDSASGAASKFSIEDITGSKVPFTVTAGAATNSIFVDSTGRIGLRTSTPVLDLHINTSNTPAVRLEQNNSGGFTAQTWDVAGNEANFFVRDVTGGSRLPFRIRPGAPTSSIDISSDGDVGIGTASPNDKLDIQCNAANKACLTVRNSAVGGFSGVEALDEAGVSSFFLGTDNTNNNTRFNSLNGFPIVFLLNSVEKLRFPTTGNIITAANGAFLSSGGVWTSVSSRAAKNGIATLPYEDALQTLRGLNPVTFRYNAEPNERYVGFVAEDVPDLVAKNDHKSLNAMDIVAVLTKVVQEQQKTIQDLNARLAELERSKP
jgi:hypothetical protein